MKRLPIPKARLLILIGGVLAGGALVRTCAPGRVENPSTWRSLDHPVRDTSTEEYAVYSTIINRLHYEDRLRVFVIRDHTAPCLRKDPWCTDKQLSNRLPHLRPETLDDYLIQNAESLDLSESFDLPRPAVMLPDRELPELLIRTKLAVNFRPLPARKIQWGKFYERYPLAPGLISLSRAGFDSQMNQALVYEEIAGNSDGSWGRYLVLKKESGKWVIADQIESYFPEAPLPSVQHGEWGTLKGQILDAKGEGLDEVQLNLLICGWDIGNLREALARDTVMLAEVVGKKTFANTDNLTTWYRFKILDTLSEKPRPKYATYSWFPDPPEEMKPLSEDEFVMAEANGQMEIDGVRITQYSNGVAYSVGATYLIFLHIDRSKRVAVRSGTEPTGVFLVGKDGTFQPYTNEPHPLGNQLARQYGNSIEKLRKALKSKRRDHSHTQFNPRPA